MLSTTFIERIISLYKTVTINIFLFSKYYNRLTKNIIERKMFIQLIHVTLASPVIKYFDQTFLGIEQDQENEKTLDFINSTPSDMKKEQIKPSINQFNYKI